MTALSEEERALIAEEEALVAAVATPYFGRLRVRTAAGERDVLLGARTCTGGPAPIVDWQSAPLAAVFFACAAGEAYELEHEGRELVGTVVRRHLVELCDGALVGLRLAGRRLSRGPDGRWRAEDDPGPRLQPRPPGARADSPVAAALDPVQRAAVELPAARSLLVLGEAGFGKTTVALHRLARLAREARAAQRPFRALVLVPTPGLQRLATRILGELAVEGARVATFAAWIAGEARRVFPALPRRLGESGDEAIGRFKRHPALRVALPKIVAGTPAMRAVRAGYSDRPETIRDLLLHLFGDRELLAEVVAASGGELPPASVDEVLAHTRVQFSPTTERALSHVAPARLRALDGRALDAGTPLHDADTVDLEDLAVAFALHRRISGTDATRHGALSRYQHVLLDEAQELAPIELELLGRAVAAGGSMTIAGDERQQVDATTRFVGWPAALAELGRPEAETVTLAASYRCPPVVEDLARAVLDPAAAPRPAPAGAPLLFTRHASLCHLVAALGEALLALREQDPRSSAAVVCRHVETARRLRSLLARALPVRLVEDGAFCFQPGVDVTCVREVKGLEFDVVIVPDIDRATYPARPEARRALYVALTRARHQVWLACAGPPSPLLPAWAACSEEHVS